ncbi:hypothetical protein [Nocardiopsis rhodophaea]|uniref:hypothetical protein n=1 Tax=Nocardiopsis rhodophaea TaxID=280238 RepID=UPI0031CE6868
MGSQPVPTRLPRLLCGGAGLPTLAALGYQGAGADVLTPSTKPAHGRNRAIDDAACDRLQHGRRRLEERGFPPLTQCWQLLEHITATPGKVGCIARVALVLNHFELGRFA